MNKLFLSKFILALLDFITFNASFSLSLLIISYYHHGYDRYLPIYQMDDRYYIHTLLGFLCVGWFAIRLRHYTYRKPFWFELKEIFRTLLIFAVFELAIIAFSKLYFSRYLWFLTWGITFLIFPFARVFVKHLLIKLSWFIRNTVIIGAGDNAFDVYNALKDEPYLGLKVICFISVSNTTNVNVGSLDIPILDNTDSWKSRMKKSDQFIIALEDNEEVDRNNWLRYFSTNGYRSVSVIPTLRGLPLYSTDMSFMFSHEMMLLRMNNNLAKLSSRILKRTMDIVGSLAIIIIFSPVLLYLYFAVKKDGGNAIYGHPRIGRNGKTFNCLKFRSMVVNSKEVLDELLRTDPEARAEWEKDFKLKNDPRITKIGAFIRKTSLDELPQLFNVLKGEMSLVGPRPIVIDELERYEENVDYYLMAKPGMTGLWQVSGRNNVDYNTRVYFDSWYVKNWSLWNDIAILFKTVNVVLNRDGAY
ncbi:MAG: undecaprenyl-phosphate galactose phosphotransferase WbaP [Haemophilus parainfluenzae]|jgi:undecaprenyl-phosphate galactose phosphotransferase|uniref:undecaprenyl-phosphate galactose phosphotransferase WbaP n=1 Tax=uncultured Haemophilus sp. TaxID=237779 RepID=UPI002595BB31|nr:undecaprenyl-phosphate galactose phosphotransferase WbaP [uncultured Haemophilus sp.]MDU3949206.1 undecaprenyl-phosphate galactose phosphotransferase WbaP [Haemophilus parainfluenzae]MDU4565178.1 undecaprenyl-phosphate galactose phosphotransferase WbaP [Haemophilus parainfluenzae]MDU4637135.1 undecaprenyl-phosphate galactose phosphotransferase WbaP [Haemophilus parainfluenzae]MDU5009448.1 undecaprenyl-phosphate galactose phosphotransferase WbaP [Haemophilus parainfluenzae]MDU5990392.1 undec